MRLSECLNSSDINTLRKIAETHDFDCHRSSKNSLIQSILYNFKNRNFIKDTLGSAPESAYRETIIHLGIDKRNTFSHEELTAFAKRAAGVKGQQESGIINQLLCDGWLYRLKSQAGKNAYHIPDDLLQSIRDYTAGFLQTRVEAAPEPPVMYRDDHLAVIRDTIQFICFVQNNELPLTQDGVIFKRHLQSLLATLEIKEEPLANPGWRFGYGRRFHDYPDRLALIYDYCFARGLIVETETEKLQVAMHAEAWIGKPEIEQLSDMFRYWRLLYRRAIPKLSVVVNTLACAVEQNWILVESVNQLLAPYVSDYYYDTQQQVMDARIYRMLIILGLLSWGSLRDGRHVIRLTELGKEILTQNGTLDKLDPPHQEETPLLIQPNFDLMLPASETGKLGWKIGQFADLVRPDAMRVYRITKHSVNRALRKDWSIDGIIEFLDKHSGYATPANVKRMLGVWGEMLSS